MPEQKLVIVGDEAWTPEEWEAAQHERDVRRAYRERNRDRMREYGRAWRAANAERVRAYKRWWYVQRRYPEWRGAIGSLHNLGCPGGHYQRRKGCTPIPLRRKLGAAA